MKFASSPSGGGRLCGELSGVTVVANANDPLVVYAAEPAHDVVWCDVPTPVEYRRVSCPKCTMPLHFVGGQVVERLRVCQAD